MQACDAGAVAQRQQVRHDLPCGADTGPLELLLVVLHQYVPNLVLFKELSHAVQHAQLEALHVHLHHADVARQDRVHAVHLELADVAVANLKRVLAGGQQAVRTRVTEAQREQRHPGHQLRVQAQATAYHLLVERPCLKGYHCEAVRCDGDGDRPDVGANVNKDRLIAWRALHLLPHCPNHLLYFSVFPLAVLADVVGHPVGLLQDVAFVEWGELGGKAAECEVTYAGSRPGFCGMDARVIEGSDAWQRPFHGQRAIEQRLYYAKQAVVHQHRAGISRSNADMGQRLLKDQAARG
eukprot:366026-Chlamydomonas_euryale.AAC.2